MIKPVTQIHVAIAIFALSNYGYTQLPESFSAGSPEAYRMIAESQRRADETLAERKRSHKITQSKKRIAQFNEAISNGTIKSVCPGPLIDLRQLTTEAMGSLWPRFFTVISVIDEENVILTSSSNVDIWLTGYPTAELTDGMDVIIIDPVKILETRSYPTITGAQRTIRAIRLATDEEYQPLLEKLEAEEKEKKRQLEELEYDDLELRNSTKIRAKITTMHDKKNHFTFLLSDGTERDYVLGAFTKSSQEKLKPRIADFERKQKSLKIRQSQQNNPDERQRKEAAKDRR